MNGFFTDNQTKQKAYDHNYNLMAKNDFVQGAKLQAKLREQSLDDASSDSLANLFQQVIGKARDYEYDTLLKKAQIAAPKPIKGNAKAYKYVPTQTDAGYRAKPTPIPDENVDMGSEEEKPSVYEKVLKDKSFTEKVWNEIKYPLTNDREAAIHDKVFNYLNGKSKAERKKLFNLKRNMTEEEMHQAADNITKIMLKRKRVKQANKPSPNLRPKVRARKISDLDLNKPASGSINQKTINEFINDVDKWSNSSRSGLFLELKRKYGDKLPSKKLGKFNIIEGFPKWGKGKSTPENMAAYKKDLKDWIKKKMD